MNTIYYGKNSRHCYVAAVSNLSGITAGEPVDNKLVFVGVNGEEKIYYFAVARDEQLLPEIIHSLEEMYGLEICKLVYVGNLLD